MFFLGFVFYKLRVFENKCISKYLSYGREGVFKGDVQLAHKENIFIGKNSYVNGGQIYAGKNSTITIGDNCMISYNVHIRTTFHRYMDRSISMIEQGMDESSIKIEDNCWIGHSAQIMPGVTIHSESVVGAGSIVTHDVPPNVVVAGVPARIVKKL